VFLIKRYDGRAVGLETIAVTIGEESIGILSAKNGDVNYSGKIDSNSEKVKGIVHTGLGNTINSGDIKLTGNSNIGVYAAGGNLLENTNNIQYFLEKYEDLEILEVEIPKNIETVRDEFGGVYISYKNFKTG